MRQPSRTHGTQKIHQESQHSTALKFIFMMRCHFLASPIVIRWSSSSKIRNEQESNPFHNNYNMIIMSIQCETQPTIAVIKLIDCNRWNVCVCSIKLECKLFSAIFEHKIERVCMEWLPVQFKPKMNPFSIQHRCYLNCLINNRQVEWFFNSISWLAQLLWLYHIYVRLKWME